MINLINLKYFFLQEAAKESKAALLSPDDCEDAESPLPAKSDKVRGLLGSRFGLVLATTWFGQICHCFGLFLGQTTLCFLSIFGPKGMCKLQNVNIFF